MASQMLEYWRKNLKTCSDSDDIFEVIDRAIFIAALDHPKEFKNHRDEIMEKLYYKTETLLDNDDLHTQKYKVFNGVDHNKVYEDISTIDHVDGVQVLVSDHAHGVISNRSKSSNNKILPVIRIKRVKKINSQDGWVATIVPTKMEGSEQVTKCYNNGSDADCQRTSNGSIHQILTQENKNSTKQVQATTVSCLNEEAMLIRQKIETSKRKLKEGYQAVAKRQHLVKVLDPRDLPKSCAAIHVSQRNCKGPAGGRNHKGPAVGRCY
ncbi:hypothetical protein FRX31_019906 [Thalictrum thalictroides]|uniref:Uncharacterized protein n=1 Tax=Thalictrum thalictroides TaxID=46969 RepID=A0A7J6W0N9_THATH|nr:hypothetical protein FRX31_019906 [Thalictrum thalictroides]